MLEEVSILTCMHKLYLAQIIVMANFLLTWSKKFDGIVSGLIVKPF